MNDTSGIVPVEEMDLVGGDVSMDLVNTASARSTGTPKDKLRSYDDLVAWAERVELVGARRADHLRRLATRDPDGAAEALERARALREVVYRVFTGDPPASDDLRALGEAAAEAAAQRRLVATDDGYAFGWPEGDALEQILWPVALSAAELLTSEDRSRVKECGGDTCNWLFVDQSRNRSRRWCDMRECGNRAKARRFQAKKKREKRSG